MVADTAPQTQQAWDLASSSGNVGQGAYQGGQAGFMGALAQEAERGHRGSIVEHTNLDRLHEPIHQGR